MSSEGKIYGRRLVGLYINGNSSDYAFVYISCGDPKRVNKCCIDVKYLFFAVVSEI